MPTTTASTPAAAAACKYPSKRRRVEAEADAQADADADTLSNLDEDCTLLILSFLRHPDLNSFAICNRHSREVRGSPLLDQTRTGVIICSETTSVLQLYRALDAGRWNNDLYSGNRTHLRVAGFERLRDLSYESYQAEVKELNRNVQLTGVTHLDLSSSTQDANGGFVQRSLSEALAIMLPNLQELNLSYLGGARNEIQIFCRVCRNLTRLTLNGSPNEVCVSGFQFERVANLTELNLDGSRINVLQIEIFLYESEENAPCMWERFTKLERLSMKNTISSFLNSRTEEVISSEPLSQAMIMKLARRHPTLQWLRSDLTQENIATLQQERPDITFVSD